jgi:nicotinamide-nucleotide amidase
MSKALVVVADNIKYDSIFMEYLVRDVKQKIGYIDNIFHLDKNDRDLFLLIEEIISNHKVVVIASSSGYSLVGRVLCTLTNDNMVIKEGKLVLSRSELFEDDSYLIDYKGTKINIIRVQEGGKLPKILINIHSQTLSFFLFEAKSEKYQDLLSNLASQYSVKLNRAEIVEGMELVVSEGFLLDQKKAFVKALAFGFHGKILFGDDLSEIVAKRLIESGKKVTMMESCTGGLVASELTKHSGVSAVFDGSIVSYSNEVKARIGVSEQTLQKYGAVSLQTLHEMLESSLKTFKADMSMAISGIAGPTGGSEEKPVGTVYVGAKSKTGETLVERLQLNGDRIYIQKQSMLWAYKLLVLCDKKIFFNFSLKSIDN